jgi:hypothetical protein
MHRTQSGSLPRIAERLGGRNSLQWARSHVRVAEPSRWAEPALRLQKREAPLPGRSAMPHLNDRHRAWVNRTTAAAGRETRHLGNGSPPKPTRKGQDGP